MNVFDEHPFQVILDYGHNPDAVRGDVPSWRERLEVKGRRIVVLAGPGRPARRGHRGDRAASRRATSTSTSAGATTTCAGATATRCRSCSAKALLAKGVPDASIMVIPDEARRWTRRCARRARATCCSSSATRSRAPGSRSCISCPKWRARARGCRRRAPRRQAHRGRATGPRRSWRTPRHRRRHFDAPSFDGDLLVRDERGVRLARESDD